MSEQGGPVNKGPAFEDYLFEWRCDAHGSISSITDNFNRITGIDGENLVGSLLFGNVDPALGKAFVTALQNSLETGQPFRDLRLALDAGGSWIELSLSGNRSNSSEGEAPEASGIGFCLDGQTMQEDESKTVSRPDAALFLRRAQELGNVGYSYRDPGSDRIFVTGPLREILGLREEFTTKEHVRDLMLDEDIPGFEAAMWRAVDEKKSARVEARFGADHSDCSYVAFQFEPVFGPDGEMTNLITVNQDITAHRRTEESLIQAQRIARIGHWRRGAEEGPAFWSETLLEIFGVTQLYDDGRLPWNFAEVFMHPDDLPGFVATRAAAIEEHTDYDAVARILRPDGRMVWVQILGHPSFDGSGKLTGTLGTVQDVTRFKDLELKVLESQKEFKRAQRLGRIGHWTFDAADKLVHYSEQAQLIFQTGAADTNTIDEILKRIHPADRSIFDDIRRKSLDGEPGYEVKTRFLKDDGSVSTLFVAAEFDRDNAGAYQRTFGIVSDITEREEAEEARRDAEMVMSDVFENADSGILVRDLGGRFIRVNTRAAIQLGLRVDQILGHSIEEVLALSNRMEAAETVREADLRVAATHGAVTYDYSHEEPGVAVTEFRVVNFPVSGPDGGVRAIATMRYDITEFMRAQNALKQLNESLERTVRERTLDLLRSEERFRNIASASADWLWELDADLRFTWCSDDFFEDTGRRPEDIIGSRISDIALGERHYEAQKDKWDNYLGKYEAREPIRDLEIDRDFPSGTRTVRVNAMPVWDQGVFKGFQGSTADITDLKQTEQKLVEAERLAALGGLVAGIAHEINTPVGASYTVATRLTDLLQALMVDLEAGKIGRSAFERFLKDTDEGLGIIRRGLERTSELVTHFKQVAVDQTSHKRRGFELHEIAMDIVATMSATLGAKDIEFEVDVPEGIGLDSYPGPLGQVMMNLIQNAIMHGFDELDGETGHIRVSGELVDPGVVALTIADDGKGMPPEVVRRVFEPFFTTKFGGGGSGLGMHLVYSIVHSVLGGVLGIDSNPGEGASITVTLPLDAPDYADDSFGQSS